MRNLYFTGLFMALLLVPITSFASPVTYENVLNGVNSKRLNAGLSELKQDKVLDKVAQDRVQDMITYNYFAHINPFTGKKYRKFFPEPDANYSGPGMARYKYIGEILARTRKLKTSEAIVSAWMNSPTHKQAMLGKQYTRTGMSISNGIVVQVFSN